MRAGAASPFGAPARILLALLVCFTAANAAAQAPAAPDPAVIANLAAAFPDASPQEIAAMAGAAPVPAATGAPAPAAAAPAPAVQPAAAPAASAGDGPVPNRGFAEPLTGVAPDFWMSIALVLAGALGGMTVTTVAFLLFRGRSVPVDDDGLRRHHELLARIAQLDQRGPQVPDARTPSEASPPGVAPPAATLTRRLGEIATRFNTIAAVPDLTLQAYLDAFAEYGTAYAAKVGPAGAVALGPEVYAGAEGVELVALALREDAVALVPAYAWLARLREGAPTPDRVGDQVAAAFGLRADGSGRLTCPRPAVVESGRAGLRLLPGQLSGFA